MKTRQRESGVPLFCAIRGPGGFKTYGMMVCGTRALMASGTARPSLCNSAIHASGIFNMATGAEDTLLWGFSLPVHAEPRAR